MITASPLSDTSAMGKPISHGRSTEANCDDIPPVAQAPHSSRWPTMTAAPSRSQSGSSKVQPNSCIIGPTKRALSEQRPVSTTSAPAASASTIPSEPRYTVAETTRPAMRSMSGSPVSRLGSRSPSRRQPSMRSVTSSPSTTPRRIRGHPCSAARAHAASAAARGFAPPPLVTIRTPRSAASGQSRSRMGTTSSIQPFAGSRSRCRWRSAIVSSARRSTPRYEMSPWRTSSTAGSTASPQ